MNSSNFEELMKLAEKESGKMEETVEPLANPVTLDNITTKTEEFSKFVQQITPEMMDKAKKLISEDQGKKLMEEMEKRGIDSQMLKSEVVKQKNTLRGLTKTSDTKQVLLITNSRQVKVRNVNVYNMETIIKSILKSGKVVELSCSRLASGPLLGKTVKLWCNPDLPNEGNSSINKRLTKIIGFPIGGEGIIVLEDGNLNEKDFLLAEKRL